MRLFVFSIIISIFISSDLNLSKDMIYTGIYKIQSKKNPKRCYIGSSKNIKKRWHYHILDLRKNAHHSKKLQRHYNKYGESDLLFTILLGCDKEDLIKHEQYFIDAYKPYFNGSLLAKGNSLLKGRVPWNKGKKTPPDVIAKLKKSHLGQSAWNKGIKTNAIPWNKGKKGLYTFKMPEEAKKKIAIAAIGNKNALGIKHSEETIQNMKRAAQKRVITAKQKEIFRQRLIKLNKTTNYREKVRSDETKRKISESLKLYNKDKKLKIAS